MDSGNVPEKSDFGASGKCLMSIFGFSIKCASVGKENFKNVKNLIFFCHKELSPKFSAQVIFFHIKSASSF